MSRRAARAVPLTGRRAMTPQAAFQAVVGPLERRLRQAIARFLNRRIAGYDLKAPNRMASLYQHVRKGDVVLVEGELRLSQLVKYVTQSPWSHSALYVGDELLRRGGRLREQALAQFGPLADRLLIEALTDEGVIAVPLSKYQGHNIRICRPWGIDPADLDRVVDSVVADLGKPYDNRNFLDLTLMLLSPIRFGALKTRTLKSCLGNCTELQVICSGMIAKAFERAGYPVLPRHYSQIVPRDFDLSPSFQVVNVDALENRLSDGGREPAAQIAGGR